MAQLATLIGDEGANIVEIEHDRLSLALNAKGAQVDIVAEVQDRAHGKRLRVALEKGEFRCDEDGLPKTDRNRSIRPAATGWRPDRTKNDSDVR